MIYFQLELTCTSVLSPVKADSPSAHAKPENEQKFLETYNTDLLDFYEGHSLPVFLQLLSFQPDNEKKPAVLRGLRRFLRRKRKN